jgi:hypothetical protein
MLGKAVMAQPSCVFLAGVFAIPLVRAFSSDKSLGPCLPPNQHPCAFLPAPAQGRREGRRGGATWQCPEHVGCDYPIFPLLDDAQGMPSMHMPRCVIYDASIIT